MSHYKIQAGNRDNDNRYNEEKLNLKAEKQ